MAFGGLFGDCGNYVGYVASVATTGKGAISHYEVPTAREAGIWTPPGPVVDSTGRLLVAVGNGASGVGDPYDYSDSILAIDPTSAKLVDSFSPSTWPTDNDADLDLGSQGPTFLSDHPAPADRLEKLQAMLPEVMPTYRQAAAQGGRGLVD